VKFGKIPALFALVLVLGAGLVGCMSVPQGSSNPVLGSWNWPNGGTVLITSDHTMTHLDGLNVVDTGTWEELPGPGTKVRLTWGSGWIDTLTLSADGKTLEGPNQNGDIITGAR
jgi:hypothetical protein